MRKKNNQGLYLLAAAVVVFSLGWWLLSLPRIEVQTLNKSPLEAGDYNVSILPPAKQVKVYSNLIVISAPFRGKDYVAAYPQDAVTVTASAGEYCVRVYTNNPNAERMKKYLQ